VQGRWAVKQTNRSFANWCLDALTTAMRPARQRHDLPDLRASNARRMGELVKSAGHHHRKHETRGNENWEFDENGLTRQRHASINELPIRESDRKFHWDRSGSRPAEHPGLTDLGL